MVQTKATIFIWRAHAWDFSYWEKPFLKAFLPSLTLNIHKIGENLKSQMMWNNVNKWGSPFCQISKDRKEILEVKVYGLNSWIWQEVVLAKLNGKLVNTYTWVYISIRR
jgi:hypothetical protein